MSNQQHLERSKTLQRVVYPLVALFAVLLPSTSAFAASFTCGENVNGPYCTYSGPVKMVYVNDSDLVLLHWDASITSDLVQTQATTVGLDQGLTNLQGAGASLYREPELANLLYATLLTAFVSDLEVTIQMRGHIGGYLEIDRIWMIE